MQSLQTNRSIFDLSGTFRRLKSCSSSRNVVPVRLGQSLPQAGHIHLKRSSPSPAFDCGIGSRNATGEVFHRTTQRSSSHAIVATAVVTADSSVGAAGDTERLGDVPAAALCTAVVNTASKTSDTPLSSLTTSRPNGPGVPSSSMQRSSPTGEAACSVHTNRAPIPSTIDRKQVSCSPRRRNCRVSAVGVERRRERGLQRGAVKITRVSCTDESGGEIQQQPCQEGGQHMLLPPSDQHQELWWDYPVSPFSPPPRWDIVAFADGSDAPLVTPRANGLGPEAFAKQAMAVLQPQKRPEPEEGKRSSVFEKGMRGYRKGFGWMAGGSRASRRRRGAEGSQGEDCGRIMHGVLPPAV